MLLQIKHSCLFNGHGDVVQLTGDTGEVLWYYDYDAFGVEREITGQDSTLDANPFRYCAEYFDTETGSIYLRARYYNPTIGRFITEDPIRDGANWYAYCMGNPIIFIDPNGLWYLVENKTYTMDMDPRNPNFGKPDGTYTMLMRMRVRVRSCWDLSSSLSESYDYDGFNRITRTVINGEEVLYTYRTDGLRHSKESASRFLG